MKEENNDKSLAMEVLDLMKAEIKDLKKYLIVLLIVNAILLLGFIYSCYDSVKVRDEIKTMENIYIKGGDIYGLQEKR